MDERNTRRSSGRRDSDRDSVNRDSENRTRSNRDTANRNQSRRDTESRSRSGRNASDKNDPEKIRKQRALRAKQKRMKQLQRNIVIGAAAAIAVFLIIGIVVKITHRGNDKQLETAAANVTAVSVDQTNQDVNAAKTQEMESEGIPQTPEPVQEPVVQAAEPVPEAVPEVTPEPTPEAVAPGLVNPTQGQVPDRSNFAVDPNVPCGSDHNNGQKVVYLTLDDGPSYLTEQVLDILDQYGVKCTFFVTAQDPEYFYVIKEAYDRGHTIGLHSYTHDYPTIYSSVDGFFQDLNMIAQVVQEQIGYVPCFIRFPGGEANMVSADYCPGIMSQLVYEVNARGYQYYNWHVSSGDGGNIDDVDLLVANATACDYPNIFLLSHDSGGHEATVAALPRIIEYYLSQGYEFRALDREAFACHAEVRN